MFIERLEEILHERKSNVTQLAKETGLTQQTIASWKTGRKPSIDKVKIICEYLNISADYLLELEPQKPDTLSETEKRLIQYFRRIDDDVGKDLILEVAKREASRYGPPKEKETEEKLSNSKVG